MKTPEQMAEEAASELSHNEAQWYVAKEGFLAGYMAGVKEARDAANCDRLAEWMERKMNAYDDMWAKVRTICNEDEE